MTVITIDNYIMNEIGKRLLFNIFIPFTTI